MTIRPYNKKDYRYVQDICIATSALADETTPVKPRVFNGVILRLLRG